MFVPTPNNIRFKSFSTKQSIHLSSLCPVQPFKKCSIQVARSQSVQQQDGNSELQDVYYKAALRLNSILNNTQNSGPELLRTQQEKETNEYIGSFGEGGGVIMSVINGAIEATVYVAFCRALDINMLGKFDSLQRQEDALLIAVIMGIVFALFRVAVWKGWHYLFPRLLENYYLQLKNSYLSGQARLLKQTDLKGAIIQEFAELTPILLFALPLMNGILTKVQGWIIQDDLEGGGFPVYLVQANSIVGVSLLACIVSWFDVLPNWTEITNVSNAISNSDKYYNELIGSGEESLKAAKAFRSVATTWIISNFQAAMFQVVLTLIEILGLQIIWLYGGNLLIPGTMFMIARFPNYYFSWQHQQEEEKKEKLKKLQQQQKEKRLQPDKQLDNDQSTKS
eukprot:TRINITY_DN64263_c0_g1_i2.p1 TRINITY_DN64263_c0_g1~~TRINITY_DN64263_c0_g1_i2.p1  ORF type:complete len:421 (-),score=39.92 TRINITY_DN64263_c0_g1_i2:630-1814(-)